MDLEAEIETAREGEPRVLVLFDLNGFKSYNDTFGHPAGDALLARLAAKLAAAVEPDGAAYRMGGDEFCVLVPAREPDLHRIAQALWESGEGFDVSSAYGAAVIPDDATTVSTALSLADERLYAHKELLAAIRAGPRTSRSCARSPSASRSSVPTWPTSRRSRCAWASGSASRPTSSRSCGSPPSCTTSASSRSPTSSCRSRDRSTRPSGASSTPTR